jgi:hypothetical protein
VPAHCYCSAPVAPAASEPFRYFSETGHNIGTRIKTFYEAMAESDLWLATAEVISETGLKSSTLSVLASSCILSSSLRITFLSRSLAEPWLRDVLTVRFTPVMAVDDEQQRSFQTGHTLRAGFRHFGKRTVG